VWFHVFDPKVRAFDSRQIMMHLKHPVIKREHAWQAVWIACHRLCISFTHFYFNSPPVNFYSFSCHTFWLVGHTLCHWTRFLSCICPDYVYMVCLGANFRRSACVLQMAWWAGMGLSCEPRAGQCGWSGSCSFPIQCWSGRNIMAFQQVTMCLLDFWVLLRLWHVVMGGFGEERQSGCSSW